ncbi:N-acetyl-gamma-glutamyl-phosphate reductase [Rhodobacterales bacterium HKCCE3408]|nr:N-acetyl-gamma-glutamyl-phosphate reductase [Rhodobacterales bacterium HKCCE3408]
MTIKVFIDGEAGTTGLQIRERLVNRRDVELISLPNETRKEIPARLEAADKADVAILCLPDASVHEIMPEMAKLSTRVIDASTAHRVDPDWTYGFPEMTAGHSDAVANAKFVANPGCYPTGAIGLLRPMVEAGLIPADAAVSINAISGYTGGGKSMIAEFETGAEDADFIYGTAQTHKHLPEMKLYSGLSVKPIFVPSVGPYAQGMVVQVPWHGAPGFAAQAMDALRAHYNGSSFVSVVERETMGVRIDPRRLNGTNRLELTVDGDPETGATVLIAVLDNLGKGASGAAVQNLNLMTGAAETSGL